MTDAVAPTRRHPTVPAVPVVVRLRRARDLMDRCYAEPLDLNALAAEAGFSRYHFARAFRATYGETPRGYLTRRPAHTLWHSHTSNRACVGANRCVRDPRRDSTAIAEKRGDHPAQ